LGRFDSGRFLSEWVVREVCFAIGANIAGFEKVAKTMLAFGVI
jgi:hypothetical protein